MGNWKYTIDISETWKKWKDKTDDDFETEQQLEEMKTELVGAVEGKLHPFDKAMLRDAGVLKKLREADSLESFNEYWSMLYDYFDYHKIWLDIFSKNESSNILK